MRIKTKILGCCYGVIVMLGNCQKACASNDLDAWERIAFQSVSSNSPPQKVRTEHPRPPATTTYKYQPYNYPRAPQRQLSRRDEERSNLRRRYETIIAERDARLAQISNDVKRLKAQIRTQEGLEEYLVEENRGLRISNDNAELEMQRSSDLIRQLSAQIDELIGVNEQLGRWNRVLLEERERGLEETVRLMREAKITFGIRERAVAGA